MTPTQIIRRLPKAEQPAAFAGWRRRQVAMYVSGLTVPTIARRTGFSTLSVYNAVKGAGVFREGYYREVNHDYFAAIDCEEKAYWLGFLTADGSVSRAGVALSLQARDRDHVLGFRAAVGSTHAITDYMTGEPTRWVKTGPRPMAKVAIHSPKMVADLTRLGVVPNKSLVVNPWPGPSHQMRHYFRGLVDGDGWLSRSPEGYWNIGLVGTLSVVTAFRDFAIESCGTRVRPRQQGNIWQVEVSGSTRARLLARALYEGATVALPRKAVLAAEAMATEPRGKAWSR